MELFQLEAFLAVVREGSFSAAAKALFRTQPAISQTIKKLEDEIGRPLFDRSSRRGVLTDAGRVLADHAERLVNLRQRALAALEDVRQLRTGRLTMAANELTCLYLLPILHEYRRLYPEGTLLRRAGILAYVSLFSLVVTAMLLGFGVLLTAWIGGGGALFLWFFYFNNRPLSN